MRKETNLGAERKRITHPFPPLYDKESKILILGSFPSVKSREQAFFYGHPQNRFWKTVAGVLSEKTPETIEEKQEFLHRNHIALWDVIQSCEIVGSSDSSIKHVVPNDLTAILEEADIRSIYCNGAKSFQYYEKYLEEQTGKKATKLPSTSPANAAFSLDRLMESWKQICGPLQAAPVGIGEILLNWYDYNARILPWRSDPTPYHVWISEIMLQQTRVEAVKKYYERWMEALPDVASLAAVEEERLMKLWEGLGYYNRARNLKVAARAIMEEYGGELPGSREALLKLKGIGEYTSGAIASIAFGLSETAVDGNVLRVFARILGEEGDITRQKIKKKLEKEVRRVLPQKRAGDFNQALMDLGAGVCLPNGQPLCEECPWESVCQAHREGREMNFPVKAKKKARRKEKKAVFLLEMMSNGTLSVILHKRPAGGLLPGLWEFPNREGQFTLEKAKKELEQWFGKTEYRIEEENVLGEGKHIFTHVEWDMVGYGFRLEVPEKQLRSVMEENDWVLVTREEAKKQYAIPSAFEKYRNFV
ncbi:MAG: A/G-specific adenine glycosylase [Eubacteriales bacterium]|nr:A/G-specific adenine glycosylase [Eubacteriales bacterium]